VRSRLVRETRGNPLALVEAVAVTEAELLGKTPIAHPLAMGISPERAFAQQLDGLASSTRDALLIAAASDTGYCREILQAMTQAGLSPNSLEPAERKRVIELVGDRIEFRHPLIRSAAYHLYDPVERRAAHSGLAAALGGGADERAVWHFAAAATGPDAEVAALLETTATAAFARNAYTGAASAFRDCRNPQSGQYRAGAPHDWRGSRTLAGRRGGARSGAAGGVVELAAEPTVRADVQELRGLAMLYASPVVANLRDAPR
jgi:hypothetical protein